jgi:hypothetical protein
MRSFQIIVALLVLAGAIIAFTHWQEMIEIFRPIINTVRAKL